MRILFDENLNWRLRRYFPGHEISTVHSLGWKGLKNGQLLQKAVEAGFDTFLTVDNNLAYQHDLSAYDIAVIVIRVDRNRLDNLVELATAIRDTLLTAPKGSTTVIGN